MVDLLIRPHLIGSRSETTASIRTNAVVTPGEFSLAVTSEGICVKTTTGRGCGGLENYVQLRNTASNHRPSPP
jgi:hypothetical protein